MQRSICRHFAGRFTRPEFLPQTHQNYNFEQFNGYTKRYEKALEQKQLMIKKLEPAQKSKRRSSLRRDTNFDIANYQAWRDFTPNATDYMSSMFVLNPSGRFVSTPKKLIDVFGPWTPAPGEFFRATACLKFMDRNLDTFWIYDVQPKDYEWVNDKADLDFALEFWKRDTDHTFWFTTSSYAEKQRFKRFILAQLRMYDAGELPSFEDRMAATYGKANHFDDFGKDYEIKRVPLIYRHSRSEFEQIGKTKLDFIDDAAYDKKFQRPLTIDEVEGVQKY